MWLHLEMRVERIGVLDSWVGIEDVCFECEVVRRWLAFPGGFLELGSLFSLS